jgi:hypothetical protein
MPVFLIRSTGLSIQSKYSSLPVMGVLLEDGAISTNYIHGPMESRIDGSRVEVIGSVTAQRFEHQLLGTCEQHESLTATPGSSCKPVEAHPQVAFAPTKPSKRPLQMQTYTIVPRRERSSAMQPIEWLNRSREPSAASFCNSNLMTTWAMSRGGFGQST